MAKKTKLVGPISCWFGFKMAQKSLKKSKTMIWTEFLKSTCKPKKVQKNPTRKPIKPDHPPDHPPAKPAQPTRPPEPINGRIIREFIFYGRTTDFPKTRPARPEPTPNLTNSFDIFLEMD